MEPLAAELDISASSINQSEEAFQWNDEPSEEVGQSMSKKKKTVQCPQCEKTFHSSNYLKIHIKRIHDLVRDHMCDVCCKTFATPQDLNNHQIVHTGEKNFPCHICGKSYQTKDYLIIHTRIHTGEKPYFCEQCGKSFADPSSFKAHTKQHLNANKTFPCEICGKVLKREKTLKLHMTIHSGGASENGGKVTFSNEFKVEALKKVKEIGAKKTSDLLHIPYTTLRNWINVCKGEHQCVECDKIYPFRASLEKHIAQKHTFDEDSSPKKPNFAHVKFDKTFKAEAALEKYQLGESTIRRWIQVTQDPVTCPICGRTCAYQKELDRHLVEVHKREDVEHPSANRPQGSLKDFMEQRGEELTFDNTPGNMNNDEIAGGPVLQSPHQIDFLNKVYREYGGGQLTRGLEKIKSIPEEELNVMIAQNSYHHLFAEPKKEASSDGEESGYDVKPSVSELLELKIETINKDFDKNRSKDVKDTDGDGRNTFENDDENMEEEQQLDDDMNFDNSEDEGSEEDESESEDVKVKAGDTGEIKFEEEEVTVKGEPEEMLSDETDVKPDMNPVTKVKKKRLRLRQKVEHGISSCEQCGKIFKKYCDLRRHMVTHTGAKDFICPVCAKRFSLEQNLARHQKIHDGIGYDCEYCKKTFSQSTSMKEHVARVHTGLLPHACKLCDAKFASYAPLMRHNISQHGAEKPLRCEECGKGFISRPELTNHMRTHTGERPYDCEKCGHQFASPSGLRAHKVKHEIEEGTISPEKLQRMEEKRIECEVCGKPFYNQSNYDRHMKGHQGIKEFQCNQCGKAYTSKRSMEQHVDVVHLGKKSFVCNVCNQSFGRTTTLRVHMLSHTKELPFRCEYCSAGYKEKRNLKKHMMKSHPEIEQSDLWQSHYLSLKEESGNNSGDSFKSKVEKQERNPSVPPWMGHNTPEENTVATHNPLSQGFRRDSDQSTSSSYNGNNTFPVSNNETLKRNPPNLQPKEDLRKVATDMPTAFTSSITHPLTEGFKRESDQPTDADFIGSNTYPGNSDSLPSEGLRMGSTAATPVSGDFRGEPVPHSLIVGLQKRYEESVSNSSFPSSIGSLRMERSHQLNEELSRGPSAIPPRGPSSATSPSGSSATPENDFRGIPGSINL